MKAKNKKLRNKDLELVRSRTSIINTNSLFNNFQFLNEN